MVTIDTNLALGIIGIAVTLLTSYLLYRGTAGAAKERAKTARKEILHSFLKAFVHDELEPKLDLANSLIRSKAREHEVNLGSLPTVPIFVEDLIASVAENDFISVEEKRNLLAKLESFQRGLVERPRSIVLPTATESIGRERLLVGLEVLISMAAGIAVVVSVLYSGSFAINGLTQILPAIAVVSVTAVTAALYTYGRSRIEREDTLKATEVTYTGPAFEAMVREAIKELGPSVSILAGPQSHEAFDFVVDGPTGRYVLEAKYTRHPLGVESVRNIIGAMYESKIEKGRIILVTNNTPTGNALDSAQKAGIIVIANVNSMDQIASKLRDVLLPTLQP